MRSLLLGLAPLLAPAAPGDAPEPARVVAMDGRVLQGDSLLPRGTSLEVRTGAKGEVVELADVLEASLGGAPSGLPPLPAAGAGPGVEVELVNRDLVRGALHAGLGEEGFVVRNPTLGEVPIPLDAVSAVRFPAAWARAPEAPALAAGGKADLFLFASGDRIEGTLRSVDAAEVKVRTAGGQDRALRTDQLLGFALVPLPRAPAKGPGVQVVLRDGSRLTCAAVEEAEGAWLLKGMAGGKDRRVPASALEGLTVRGGRGTALPDLEPASVEVKAYWGDDPPALGLRPRFDRALVLDPGPAPPLRLGGRTWYRGVSAFSGTTVTWDIAGKGFRTFTAAVGVDDAGPKGRVEFEVLLDGKSAWRSAPVGTVAPGAEPVPVPALDVSAAKSLSLVVHFGPGQDVQDFADWVRPALRP